MTENNGSRPDEHHEVYEERAVTMGTLGMWIPIGLTVFGLFITSLSVVVSMAVQNATHIAKLEANMETIQQTLTYQRDEQKRTAQQLDDLRATLYRQQSNEQQRTNVR